MPILRRTIEQRLEEFRWRQPNGCWKWLGALTTQGRPQIWYKGRYVLATRLIMHLEKGFDLSSPLLICHNESVCSEPECWNPEHLYIGTQKDNHRDRVSKITHCPKGHEYNEENTYHGKHGRSCRQCQRIRYSQV